MSLNRRDCLGVCTERERESDKMSTTCQKHIVLFYKNENKNHMFSVVVINLFLLLLLFLVIFWISWVIVITRSR